MEPNTDTHEIVNNTTDPQAKMVKSVMSKIKNKTVGSKKLPSLKSGARPVK